MTTDNMANFFLPESEIDISVKIINNKAAQAWFKKFNQNTHVEIGTVVVRIATHEDVYVKYFEPLNGGNSGMKRALAYANKYATQLEATVDKTK